MSAMNTNFVLVKRLTGELKSLKQPGTLPEGITVTPRCQPDGSPSMELWDAVIAGPPGSLYEGGDFKLTLDFRPREDRQGKKMELYPFGAPGVKFVTPIYHPNVSQTGSICLSTLQDGWSPSLRIVVVLQTIQGLLEDPNPDDPLNGDAGALMRNDPEQFKQFVREHIEQHAQPTHPERASIKSPQKALISPRSDMTISPRLDGASSLTL